MKTMRTTILGFLTAVIMALVLPGITHAQVSKLYGLNVTSATPITSPSGEITLTATFKNLSPKNANSSFNSLRLVAPAGVTITTTAGATTPAPTAITAGEIRYENLSPVGKDGAFVFTFKATFNTSACTLTWNPAPDDDVWTGSQINSGNPFAKVVSAAYPSSTTLTGTPSIALAITYPAGVSSDSVVKGPPGYAATATVTGACSPAGAPVTFPASGNSNVTVVPASPTTNSSGVASFTVTFGQSGPASLTASVLGVNSNTLNFTVYDGILNCAQKAGTSSSIDVSQDWSYPQGTALDPGWSLIRGVNKDGAPCVSVPFTFTQDTTSNPQTASFIVPASVTATQKVSAEYIVVWAPIPTSQAWIVKRPKLAWKKVGNVETGAPIYMPALACVTDPIDFSAVPQSGLDALLPVIPDEWPYNVTPLLETYGVNVKAKMCVAQQGWTSLGPVQPGDETLVQNWTKVIDQGDGFMTND